MKDIFVAYTSVQEVSYRIDRLVWCRKDFFLPYFFWFWAPFVEGISDVLQDRHFQVAQLKTLGE